MNTAASKSEAHARKRTHRHTYSLASSVRYSLSLVGIRVVERDRCRIVIIGFQLHVPFFIQNEARNGDGKWSKDGPNDSLRVNPLATVRRVHMGLWIKLMASVPAIGGNSRGKMTLWTFF